MWDIKKLAAFEAKRSFRYEDFYTTEKEAMEQAAVRSTKTLKTIHVSKIPNEFVVEAHGVAMIGWQRLASFKQGIRLC